MKTLIISGIVLGLSATGFTAQASESILYDLAAFESGEYSAPVSHDRMGSQPEVGSSESLLEDLQLFRHTGYKSTSYSSGEVGNESLLDDLDRF